MRRFTALLDTPYVVAVLLVGAATIVRQLFDPYLQEGYVFSWYYVAVMLAALRGGWKPAIVAVLLGYAAAEWFFIEPRYTWSALDWKADDVAAMVMYLLVGLVIAAGGEAMRRTRLRLAELQTIRSERAIAARTPLDSSEMREVAAAVRRHGLTSKDLWPYLVGLSASQGLLDLAMVWDRLRLSSADLAQRLEKLAREGVSPETVLDDPH